MAKFTTLGLDLGIASIGWCLFEDINDECEHKKIIDLGSFIFPQIEDQKSGKTENVNRREKRLMRRQRRRKCRRLADGRALFKKYLSIDNFLSLNFHEYKTPMEIKVKGTKEKLTKEELAIALYHYLKYRGFKSNKKNEKPSDGDLSKKMDETETAVEKSHSFVTEYLLKNVSSNDQRSKTGHKYHNGAFKIDKNDPNKYSDIYNLPITRKLYLDEIEAILNKQIEEKIISEEFKDEYINLFTRQRDYSDGPDKSSKYHVDFNKLVGTCIYDNNKRAPVDSFCAQEFKFLTKVINIRYKIIYSNGDSSDYKTLNKDQVKKLYNNYFVKNKSLNYEQLFKELEIKEKVLIKSLQLSKSKIKALHKNTSSNEDYAEKYDKELKKQKVYEPSKFIKEYFKKVNLKESKDLKSYLTNPNVIDTLSYISLICKTDNKIKKEIEDSKELDDNYKKDIIDFVQGLEEDATKVMHLSKEILRKINYKLLNDDNVNNYYDALNSLNYTNENGETKSIDKIKSKFLPSVDEMLKRLNKEKLNNPVVKHTLVKLRILLNEIIKTYGKPTNVCIELARELKKNFNDRKNITINQLENRDKNTSDKNEILEKYGDKFPSLSSIKYLDLLRYKLFKQQNENSPYTNKKISNPFDILYEIDHIIPYSISFDDSFNNKVLVEKTQNDIKSNRLPMNVPEIKDNVIKFLNSHNIYGKKRENLLLKKFDPDENFLNKDANDNAYIALLAKDIINSFVLEKGKNCMPTSGAVTEKLRNEWRLGGKTHSYVPNSSYNDNISRSYTDKSIYDFKYKGMKKENNDKKITFICELNNKICDFSIEIKGDKKPNNNKQDVQNIIIRKFINSFDYLNEKFKENESFINLINTNNGEDFNKVLGIIYNQMLVSSLKKNRENDLHHALDAAIIGCVTPKVTKRITNYYKNKELNINVNTGEEKDSGTPLPYKDFPKEVLLRLYERDQDKMIEKLNKLDNYKDSPANKENIHLVYPARLPDNDIIGPISNETIYGSKELNNKKILTKKISIYDLKQEDIENVKKAYGNDKGINPMINAIEEWLKQKSDSRQETFPKLPKKNTPIKYVKIWISDRPETKVDLGNNRYADNSTVVKVLLLKRKNNGDIAMAPVYYNQIWKEKENRKRISNNKKLLPIPKYQVMWKQGEDGYNYLTMGKIKEEYNIIQEIPRNSLIEIKTKDSNYTYAYSGGVTSGIFEVYSVLGDNFDLKNFSLISNENKARIQITISTIENIKVLHMSPIGIIK